MDSPDLQVISCWIFGNSLQESIRPTAMPVGIGTDDIRSVEISLVDSKIAGFLGFMTYNLATLIGSTNFF